MTSPGDGSGVRDRIEKTAFDLFYRQGYRATGINQIIAESEVAKASFYDHFPSKEDLLAAYVESTSGYELGQVQEEVSRFKTPLQRFFAPLDILIPWFTESRYRGCPFQNILAEAPTDDPRIAKIALRHRERMREFFRDLARDLKAGGGIRASTSAEGIANFYLILFEGAIAVAVAYRDPWPVKEAKKVLKRLIAAD